MPGIKNVWIWSMVTLMLGACGTKDACDRPQEYVFSKSSERLVVPDNLSAPDPAKNRDIPSISGERKERSDPCSVLPPELVVAKTNAAASGTAAAAKSAFAAPSPGREPLEIGEPFNGGPVATLNAWVEAWSKADIPAYLAFYSEDYRTPDEVENRETWLHRRKELIESTGPADISIRDLTFEDLALGRKMVRLIQDFKSPTGLRSVVKLIELTPEGGGYRIRHELVVGLL